MAILIFFAATARARVIPARLLALKTGTVVILPVFSDKVDIVCRRYLECELSIASLVRYCEVSSLNNVHAYQYVKPNQVPLGSLNEWNDYFVREVYVNQVRIHKVWLWGTGSKDLAYATWL